MSSAASSASSGSQHSAARADPVLRNALRYTVSAREYELLHRYLISQAPAVKKRSVPPARYEAIVKRKGDYNAAAIRASIRVFLGTYTSCKLYEIITERLLSRSGSKKTKTSVWKSLNIRLSASFSFILLFYRLLHRFFTRLRESLLTESAQPFRRRNPKVAKALTSTLAPAVGAGLSGLFLGLCPADQLRITITIYALTRALEFGYNGLEERGWFKNRPWWFGSWLLMPVACGQLLHAFVFDRDCFPESFGRWIMKYSPEYIQQRPPNYPPNKPWPGTYDIVDSLAEISRLNWPSFTSPILYPHARLPPSLPSISPITSPAHPSHTRLSCALLHPTDPSCPRTYLSFFLRSFPSTARLFTLLLTPLALLTRWRAFLHSPLSASNALAARILRLSAFFTGAVGTAWGCICLFQSVLPRRVLPTQRWFLGGAVAGLWAVLEREGGRANFLYSARLSLDSVWKVGRKRGWWRGWRNGDVLVFTASVVLMSVLFEAQPKAVRGAVVRKGFGVVRGDGWVDRVGGGKQEETGGERDAEGRIVEGTEDSAEKKSA
ncbi:hypothetical protein EV356DRAFT_568726 [Viridothelium virens]|uniref:Transmembrane protein 135 N-terminal domain-containing protein n=1 Tax=Viridothelium virens TaxID=1048519 RepID=A0A6A6H398_VIRVR|nr:hypothetical protein EV356DRAFT_568726 [Viridothelium virens]